MTRIDPNPAPFVDTSRVRQPKGGETISTTTRAEMQRRDRALVYISGVGQNLNALTPTAIDWTAETYDDAGMHSTAVNPSRMTVYQADAAGFAWYLAAQICWNTSGVGYRSIAIQRTRSGAPLFVARSLISAVAGVNTWHSVNVILDDVRPGDYFEVIAEQSSGGILAVNGGAQDVSFFQAIALW